MKIKCDKHPKFKGRNKPKHQCIDCLLLYLLIKNKPRSPHRPTKTIQDKTKYNRKKKYKGEYDG